MKENSIPFRILTLVFWAMTLCSVSFAQSSVVTGKVVSGEDKQALPGVTISVKNTQKGVMTDVNGKYKIEIAGPNAVLVFSYVGFEVKEVTVGTQAIIDVELEANQNMLDDLVVTALGIKREERSLGYSVGKVKGEDLSRVANDNILTGIAGKVPGVSISSTGGTGSSVSMVIRGATSLSNDNQPLFVIDGVPVANGLNNVGSVGGDNRVDYGNPISSLNPEDVESISILKGPSAAALYGSRAGNGVVLVTTKTGRGLDKMQITYSNNTVFDKPYKFLKMHKSYATGIVPLTPGDMPNGSPLVIDEGSAAGMGPQLDKGYYAIQWNSPLDANGNLVATPLVSHPNNIENFVQTGITTTNNISIANSSKSLDYRLSYANMINKGIIPGSDLFRNSLNINSTMRLTSNLSLSAQVDFSRNGADNRPAGNRGANPMQAAYVVSPHINILDLKNYWADGQEGLVQRSVALGEKDNPYFLAHEVKNSFSRNRVFGNLRADWQITPKLSLMGRYALDFYKEDRETKIPFSYTNEPRGAYGISNLTRQEQNIDFLASYKESLGKFNFLASAGGNVRHQLNKDVSNSTKNGAGLITPGLYTLSNISPNGLNYGSYLSEKVVNSVYGLVNVGYNDMVYLDLTARNDWSSTLPKKNRSYFYPSASLSVLADKVLNLPAQINMLKLRAGVAQVGNDTNPYSLTSTLGNAGAWGNTVRLTKSGTLLIPDLKPEISTSYELGLDFSAFKNRLRFEGTYYKVDNKNQIIPTTLPGSSGFGSMNINAGLLSSRGIELMLGGTLYKSKDWNWDLNVNWSRNRAKLVRLADGLDFYTFWTEGRGGARTYVGEDIGDIVDSKLVTVEDKSSPYYGYPILDANGSWQAVRINNTRNKIGNFNPDFTMGLQSSVSYKRFTLNVAIDTRVGGKFMSQTYRYFESDMRTQRFLDNLINPNGMTGDQLRDYLVNNDLVRVDGNEFRIVGGPTKELGGYYMDMGSVKGDFGVFNPGVIAEYNAAGELIGYKENLGGEGTKYIPYTNNYPWDFMSASTFDADFIKLRELSVAYNLPSNFLKKIKMQNASISVYTRNLILWTKANIGIDPELAFQPESGVQGGGIMFKQGIERYNVTPWSMPIGFKLNVTF